MPNLTIRKDNYMPQSRSVTCGTNFSVCLPTCISTYISPTPTSAFVAGETVIFTANWFAESGCGCDFQVTEAVWTITSGNTSVATVISSTGLTCSVYAVGEGHFTLQCVATIANPNDLTSTDERTWVGGYTVVCGDVTLSPDSGITIDGSASTSQSNPYNACTVSGGQANDLTLGVTGVSGLYSVTYSISQGGGIASITQSGGTYYLHPTGSGIVKLTGSVVNSCSDTVVASLPDAYVNFIAAPTTISISGNSTVSGCTANGLQVALTGNNDQQGTSAPGYSESWAVESGPGVLSTLSGSATTLTFSATGTVTVGYTATTQCGSIYTSKNITAYQYGTVSGAAISTPPTLCCGGTITLSGSYSANNSKTPRLTVWTSSNTNVATVTSDGVVSGVATGNSVVITYKVIDGCGGETSASTTINVYGKVSNPTTSGTHEIITGGTCVLAGSFTNNNALLSGTGQTYGVWSVVSGGTLLSSSSQTGYDLTISAGNAIGNVTLRYTINSYCGVSGSSYVDHALHITDCTPCNTVSITNVPSYMCLGGQRTLGYDGCASFTPTTWGTTNANAITVTQAGVITANAVGSAEITLTGTDCTGQTLSTTSTTITVYGNISDLSVTPSAVTIFTGETATLNGTYTNNNAHGVSYGWSVGDSSIATIESGGNTLSPTIKGVLGGSTTLTFTVESDCETETYDVPITVTACTPPSNPVVSNLSNLCPGATATATCSYSGGNPTPSKTWSSSNTGVATVNASGVVTAVTGGNATIYCVVSNTCGTVTGSTSVAVYNKISSAALNKTTHSGCPGTTVQLSITGTSPTNLSTTGVSWSSNNTSVATVNSSSGLVTLVTGGSATIIATVTDSCGGSVTASCAVSVTKTVAGASLSGGVVIYNGETLSLTTGYTPTDAAIASKALSGGNTYLSVGSTNVVTGLTNATGNSSQSVTVTFTATDGCGNSKQATTSVTVRQHVTAATLSSTSLTLDVAATNTLTPGFSPSNAYGVTYAWLSSDTTVATVNSGVVTGVKKGTATITLTATDGASTSVTKTCTVTVKNPNVTGVTVPASITEVICGSTASVTVSVTPSSSAASANITGWTVTNTDGLDSVLAQGRIAVSNSPEASTGNTITISGAKAGVAKVNVTAMDDNGQNASASFNVLITTEVSEDNNKIGRRAWFNDYRLPMFNEEDTTKVPTKSEILAAAQRGNLATYASLTINGDYTDNQIVKESDVAVAPLPE